MKIPWWILPLSALWIYKQRTNLCGASSPCSLNNGGCSQLCVPKNSRHECQCLTGLPEEKDGKTCEDKVNKLILFTDAEANSANIIFLGANYSVSRTLFKDPDSDFLVALDFDRVQDRVYWTDESRGRIMSAFRNGSSAKILYFCNVLRPVGLAIDHVGRNVYWTDAGTDRIEIGRLDGTKRKVLFKDGLDEPGAIVLDEKNGLIFWTDHGNEPKIEKAETDGSGRMSIVTKDLFQPSGLTIDHAKKHLYWADAKGTIEMSNLDGGSKKVILSSNKIHPFRLALYKNVLLWTDRINKSILSYNLTSGKQEKVVTDLQNPMDIHVYDPSMSYSGSNMTAQNTLECSDFLLPLPGGLKCACPKTDGKSCDNASVSRCPQLCAPYNGSLQSCSNLPGQTCRFSCDKGYLLKGSATRTCRDNGTWSGAETQCNAVICGPLIPPTNVTISPSSCLNSSTYNQTCRFSCQTSGYVLNGSSSRVCSDDGSWTGSNNTRCRPIRCPQLSAPLNGSLQNCSNLPRQTCRFSCDKGYLPMGSATRTCRDNGTWSGAEIKCNVINCSKLMVSQGGPLRMSSCGNHYGAKCNFSCPIGHRLKGSSSLTCVAQSDSPSGSWDKRLPTCHAVICGPIIPPTNVTISPSSCLTSSRYNQTCIFSCQTSRYVLIGCSSRVCSNDGSWTGSNNARCRLSNDEMKLNTEDRTPHYQLACGILATAVILILIIFTFIYKKKLRGPTRERPPLTTNQFTGVVLRDRSNHGYIHCEDKLEKVNSPRQNSKESNVPEMTAGSSTSSILKEVGRDNFGIKSKQDSKLLSSLQDSGSFQERVCNRLDREKKSGVSGFHKVCSHYDVDEDKVAAVFEKYPAGPSTALLEYLAATHPQLTVAEFASVLRKIAKRSDVAKLLEEYDNQ